MYVLVRTRIMYMCVCVMHIVPMHVCVRTDAHHVCTCTDAHHVHVCDAHGAHARMCTHANPFSAAEWMAQDVNQDGTGNAQATISKRKPLQTNRIPNRARQRAASARRFMMTLALRKPDLASENPYKKIRIPNCASQRADSR